MSTFNSKLKKNYQIKKWTKDRQSLVPSPPIWPNRTPAHTKYIDFDLQNDDFDVKIVQKIVILDDFPIFRPPKSMKIVDFRQKIEN